MPPVRGSVVQGSLWKQKVCTYSLFLQAGDYIRLVVFHQDVGFRLIINAPNDALIREVESRHWGPTSLTTTVPSKGTYTIKLFSLENDNKSRAFSLSLEDFGPLTASRRLKLAADNAFQEANVLASIWSRESLSEAIPLYRKSFQLWLRTGDFHNSAIVMTRLGRAYESIGERDQALHCYEQAERNAKIASDIRTEVDSLNDKALLLFNRAMYAKAGPAAQEAKALSISSGYPSGQALAFAALANISYGQNNVSKARDLLKTVFSLLEECSNRRVEALGLLTTGYLESGDHNYKSAEETTSRALTLLAELNDTEGQAWALQTMGSYYDNSGELERALITYNEALTLFSAVGDLNGQASLLDDLGHYSEAIGEHRALPLYERAASIAKVLHQDLVYGYILSDLSRITYTLGLGHRALYYSSLESKWAARVGDPWIRSNALMDTGDAFLALGAPLRALPYFNQALHSHLIDDLPANQVDIQMRLAMAFDKLGRKGESYKAYSSALSISERIDYKQAQADAHYYLAEIMARDGRPNDALAHIQEAVELSEALRVAAGSGRIGAQWFASVHRYYELYVEIAMRLHVGTPELGLDKVAFNISERSRSRSLVDILHESEMQTVADGDADLRSQDAAIHRATSELIDDQVSLLGTSQSIQSKHNFTAELDELQRRDQSLRAEMRSSVSGKPDGLAAPLTADKVQTMLGDDDLVLEYFLSERQSYVWAITKNSFSSYSLPPKKAIETAVETFRHSVGLQDVANTASFQNQLLASAKLTLSYERSQELGTLLLAPVGNLLDHRRLLIVSDGLLQYVPFSALVCPRGNTGQASGNDGYMIASHEVVNLPSLSTIAILRSRPANRYVPGREVAVLADPVFQRDDPRISAQSAIPGGHMTPQAALGLDSSLRRVDKLWLRLPRLPATRKEAAAVSRFAPSGTAKIALDFDASRTTALSDELKSFRILHFATHSLVSVDQPDESGIVLSLFDSTGNPRNGYLSLRDIYDMRLSADLVVLSACDTALGKNIRGEGIVSLARGFMYAGSSRLIATLWKVDDEATFEFMQQFYKSLFQGRLTPAAALREAQIAVSLKARWHSPYYWAAFVLEGEWR